MKISYNWLGEFIKLDAKPEKVARLLTMSGTEVENIFTPADNVRKIVVVKVVAFKKVKGKDGYLATIFDGKKNYQLKAHNKLLIEGLYPFDIQKGIFISAKQLGIGDDDQPLRIESGKPGMPLSILLGWDDKIFEMEVTPNRPDCLSHLGIARELSVLLDKPIKLPEFKLKEETRNKIEDYISVEIKDFELCPRYACRVISSVNVASSPLEIAGRLAVLGIRPINNVVDATNITLLELGHPLHAFDWSEIKGRKIIVRPSKKGEKILTLDGVERKLPKGILTISSQTEPIAVAGIMGGEDSGVVTGTRRIVLESAYFSPSIIRRGEQKLDLTSESSTRFSKGTDPNLVPFALDRVAWWVKELAGGRVAKGKIDIKEGDFKPTLVRLRSDKLRGLIGARLRLSKAKKYLTSLGLKQKSGNKKAILFEIPTYRPDLEREEDLIEEVGRLWGYKKLKPLFRLQGPLTSNTQSFFLTKRAIARLLAEWGFQETVTNPMGSIDELSLFDRKGNIVDILNPVSQEYAYLRSTLLSSLLRVASHNHRHNNLDLRIFEIGRTYHYDTPGYKENDCLAIALSGSLFPLNWSNPSDQVDIFYAKGLVEMLLNKLGISDYSISPHPHSPKFLSPEYTLQLDIKSAKQNGIIGRLSEKIARNAKLKCPLYFIQLPLEQEVFTPTPPKYQPFSREPRVRRDLSIIISEDINAGDIIQEINESSKFITEVRLYDLYKGKGLSRDRRSLTFAIFYQREEGSLTDEEVNTIHQRVTKKVLKKFDAELRGL